VVVHVPVQLMLHLNQSEQVRGSHMDLCFL
jgi:hypothetical protein